MSNKPSDEIGRGRIHIPVHMMERWWEILCSVVDVHRRDDLTSECKSNLWTMLLQLKVVVKDDYTTDENRVVTVRKDFIDYLISKITPMLSSGEFNTVWVRNACVDLNEWILIASIRRRSINF